MGEEDALRTVECLRGRLLAERIASKNAKEEAQLIGNKLIELENRLKEETKARNRAEKRLKFLMKKLESINISFVSDNSCFTEGSEVSSASYTANSSSKDLEDNKPDNEILKADSKKCDMEHSDMNKYVAILNNVEKIGSRNVNDLDREENVDNSLALVSVDLPQPPKQTIDPAVLDATVRDVLDTLRHAKEKLQNQMERRRMIKVG